MQKVLRPLVIVFCSYLSVALVAGIVIGEGSLKLARRPLLHRQEIRAAVHQRYGTDLEDVSIGANDGAVLLAWYIQPRGYNGSSVILLHGITDNREGMAGFAKLFLDHGYAALLPDARAHGESGGELARTD